MPPTVATSSGLGAPGAGTGRGRLGGLGNALAELRHHPQRLIGVAVAVILSVGFLTSSLVLVATEQNGLQSSLVAPYSRSDVIVQSTDFEPGEDYQARIDRAASALAAVDGVEAVEPLWEGGGRLVDPQIDVAIATAMTNPRLSWTGPVTGQWPSRAGEAAVSAASAQRHRLAIGDTVTLSGQRPLTLRIVGLLDTRSSLLSGISDELFLSRADLAANPDFVGLPSYLVAARPGVDPAALAARVKAAYQRLTPGVEPSVEPTAQYAERTLAHLTGGFAVFGALLIGFASVALLVTTIIIANTFQIIVAQRRRQIGLIRLIGADARRVARDLLIESAVVGAVSALIGTALGIGLAAIGAAFTGSLTWGLQVPWPLLAVAVAFGVLVTVLGAYGPARHAMAVPPLAALRPATSDESRRTGRGLAIVAAVLVVLGLAQVLPAMTLVTDISSLLLAISGSFLIALGVLLAARFVIPPMIRLLGGLAGRLGAPGRLAVANALRNPRRSTATGVALMLAIGLVVTLQVGAATMTASAAAQLDSRFPVDLVAGYGDRQVTAAQRDRVRAIPGVSAAELVPSVELALGDAGLRAVGLPKDSPVVAAGLDQLDEGRVLIRASTAKALSLTAGQQVEVRIPGGRRVLTATVVFSTAAPDFGAVLTPADLAKAASKADPSAPAVTDLWIAVAPGADAPALLGAVQEVLGADGFVEGALVYRQLMESVLNVLVGVASALMGVAVLIALIGVGNTVSLSVLERAREFALLRALGLQRRQLRWSVVIECVLLALAGSLVGILAGIGFGWLGAAAILRSSGQDGATFAISVPATLAVVLVALLAGAVASLPPSRRALQASPAAALAGE